jgi:hypothetical protein
LRNNWRGTGRPMKGWAICAPMAIPMVTPGANFTVLLLGLPPAWFPAKRVSEQWGTRPYPHQAPRGKASQALRRDDACLSLAGSAVLQEEWHALTWRDALGSLVLRPPTASRDTGHSCAMQNGRSRRLSPLPLRATLPACFGNSATIKEVIQGAHPHASRIPGHHGREHARGELEYHCSASGL